MTSAATQLAHVRPNLPHRPDLAVHELLVDGVTREAEKVVSVRLVHPDGQPLPEWTPGAHLDVLLPSGRLRQYSLCGDPDERAAYRIAVLHELHGRGGSTEIHQTPLVGRMLGIRGPRNHFPLSDAPRYLFLAGGIGITPILAMARQASRMGTPWRLVYGARSHAGMAFVDELLDLPGGDVEFVPQDDRGLPDLKAILSAVDEDTAVYCCGPEPMIAAAEETSGRLVPRGGLHVERFAAAAEPQPANAPKAQEPPDGSFEVELRRSGAVLTVPPDRTLLDVVREVVPDMQSSCEEGFCGACETPVLEGRPEHRDAILTEEERERGHTMMICVGRSYSARLVLDL